ncbi:Phosphotransferase [Taxawa tesnikishii (nom. ined.)]|nr:Phosphotransferase [Dothideales sp. JES 119]
MVYIRQDRLPKLKEYKYSGVDHSLVSRYVLKPFYTNFVIHCFPMSMAPNMITLTGFGFVIVNLMTMLYYSPTLDQDCPSWVYASWSIGLFLYQTFDAVDGTQARRTRQSGPLGELFDHGVDACNTSLEVLLFAAAMNFGQGWKTVLTLLHVSDSILITLLTFYVQTWDEYHTKTLTLGLVSGPVEGILTLCIVYAFTAIKGGGSFWQQPMLATLGVAHHTFIPDMVYDLAWNEWYMVYGGVVLIFNTVASPPPPRPVRPLSLLGLLPFFLAWTLIPLYLYLQPMILHEHLVPFVVYVGLINAYSVGQMIVAHLTKSAFPYTNVLVYPLAFGVVDSLGPRLSLWPSALGEGVYQVAFMFCCFGLAIGVYGSFVIDVIVSICDYLDIWCLTIKHPYVPVEDPASGEIKTKST